LFDNENSCSVSGPQTSLLAELEVAIVGQVPSSTENRNVLNLVPPQSTTTMASYHDHHDQHDQHDQLPSPPQDLSASGLTMPSDSEAYSSISPPSSSPPDSSNNNGGQPVIIYQPPTIWGLLRGAAINLLLPFVNGLMLGFGELFAHEFAFRLGWSQTNVSARTGSLDGQTLIVAGLPFTSGYSSSRTRRRTQRWSRGEKATERDFRTRTRRYGCTWVAEHSRHKGQYHNGRSQSATIFSHVHTGVDNAQTPLSLRAPARQILGLELQLDLMHQVVFRQENRLDNKTTVGPPPMASNQVRPQDGRSSIKVAQFCTIPCWI